MAAFYLLLTTGMFVCFVHCAAAKIIEPKAMQMSAMHHPSKDCAHGNDCDCCKKHGSFVIKENIKTGIAINFAQTAILIHHFEIAGLLPEQPVIADNFHDWSNAPPGKTGKAIAIQNCSLLI